MSRMCAAFAVIGLLLACSRGPEAPKSEMGASVPPTTRVVDGITVIEHPADAFERAPQFTIDTTPLAVMGGAGGDPSYDLQYAREVVALRDGRYATFRSIGNLLMIFDARGKGQRIWGSTGEGPGYFMRTQGMLLLPGDTIFLADEANRRLNWVLPDKGVVRQEPMVQAPREFFGLHVTGRLRDGHVVLVSYIVPPISSDSKIRRPTPIIVATLRGDTVRGVDSIPGMELRQVESRFRGRKGVVTMPVRFGLVHQITAWDTMIATGGGPDYTIDLHRPDGRTIGRIQVPRQRRPVTTAMRQALIAEELERMNATGGEGMVDPEESKRLTREQPFADSLAPYGKFYVTDGEKTLWVVDIVTSSDTGWHATAFRRDGSIIGRLNVTSGQGAPLAFTDDRVLVRTEEKDGLIAFKVYRIIPRP